MPPAEPLHRVGATVAVVLALVATGFLPATSAVHVPEHEAPPISESEEDFEREDLGEDEGGLDVVEGIRGMWEGFLDTLSDLAGGDWNPFVTATIVAAEPSTADPAGWLAERVAGFTTWLANSLEWAGDAFDREPVGPDANDLGKDQPVDEGASGAFDQGEATGNYDVWGFGNRTEQREVAEVTGPPGPDVEAPEDEVAEAEADPGTREDTFPDLGPRRNMATQAGTPDTQGAVEASGLLQVADAEEGFGRSLSDAFQWASNAFNQLLTPDDDGEPIQEDEEDVQGDEEICHWWETCPEDDEEPAPEGREPEAEDADGFLQGIAQWLDDVFDLEEDTDASDA